MNITDSANILNISGNLTKKIIKEAYRKAAAKFHPDRDGGNAEIMKMINEAYESLKDYEGFVQADNFDYPDLVAAAINKIIDLVGLDIEVCGNWVWVTGNTKVHAKTLGRSGAGFTYASKKKAWFYRPDDYKSASRGSMSLDDIREYHGSDKIQTKSKRQLTA